MTTTTCDLLAFLKAYFKISTAACRGDAKVILRRASKLHLVVSAERLRKKVFTSRAFVFVRERRIALGDELMRKMASFLERQLK